MTNLKYLYVMSNPYCIRLKYYKLGITTQLDTYLQDVQMSYPSEPECVMQYLIIQPIQCDDNQEYRIICIMKTYFSQYIVSNSDYMQFNNISYSAFCRLFQKFIEHSALIPYINKEPAQVINIMNTYDHLYTVTNIKLNNWYKHILEQYSQPTDYTKIILWCVVFTLSSYCGFTLFH